MFIHFGGKTAQEHQLHRLDPGVNEVPDDIGRRLKRIGKDGGLPIRDASPAEEKAFKEARSKREAEIKATAEKDRQAAAAAAAAAATVEDDEGEPAAGVAAESGKAKA